MSRSAGSDQSTFSSTRQPQHSHNIDHEKHDPRKDRSWLARVWKRIDFDCMKPMLTHSRPTLMDTLPGCCLPCAKLCTSSEQVEPCSSEDGSVKEESGENEVYDLSYTEVGGSDSMVCSSPSKKIPLLDSGKTIKVYDAGFTS